MRPPRTWRRRVCCTPRASACGRLRVLTDAWKASEITPIRPGEPPAAAGLPGDSEPHSQDVCAKCEESTSFDASRKHFRLNAFAQRAQKITLPAGVRVPVAFATGLWGFTTSRRIVGLVFGHGTAWRKDRADSRAAHILFDVLAAGSGAAACSCVPLASPAVRSTRGSPSRGRGRRWSFRRTRSSPSHFCSRGRGIGCCTCWPRPSATTCHTRPPGRRSHTCCSVSWRTTPGR